MTTGLLSTATIATVGLLSKAFLNLAPASVSVNGLSTLLRALDCEERTRGRGIITGPFFSVVRATLLLTQFKSFQPHLNVCTNIISVLNAVDDFLPTSLDDPVTWGVLPTRCYFSSRMTRWTLGASDVIFINPLFCYFFRLGQTIEITRGKGIYQPAVDIAIDKLNQGHWIHLYSEGKICQPDTYLRDANGNASLSRFKWGIGRMLMEANVAPVIIPTWLTGFDRLMPEGRTFPYKYIPRLGAHLSVTFGDPLSAGELEKISSLRRKTLDTDQSRRPDLKDPGWAECALPNSTSRSISMTELDETRSEITDVVRRAVLALGRSVSGPTLSR
ncbi:hypothetical protein AX17_001220 [Amanita inopinata Kibby_2008]|nr:hypothetical protein AX17_001220 [Amanita inopinata Kibby_2008]